MLARCDAVIPVRGVFCLSPVAEQAVCRKRAIRLFREMGSRQD